MGKKLIEEVSDEEFDGNFDDYDDEQGGFSDDSDAPVAISKKDA